MGQRESSKLRLRYVHTYLQPRSSGNSCMYDENGKENPNIEGEWIKLSLRLSLFTFTLRIYSKKDEGGRGKVIEYKFGA